MENKQCSCFSWGVKALSSGKNNYIVWLICCLLAFHLNAYAEIQQADKQVTFASQTLTIKQLFIGINKQTGYRFFFNNNVLNVEQRVTLPKKSLRVSEALKSALGDKYTYKVMGDKIVISVKVPSGSKPDSKLVTVAGRVTDSSGEPLPGVNVMLIGSSKGASTGADGRFSFSLEKTPNMRFRFSFIGMKPVEQVWKGGEMNVVLEEEVGMMDEVVVTGIFNKPRESYVGAVSTITQKDLKMYKGQNMLQTLRNIDPAINLVQNNLAGSNPNTVPELNIRGTSALPMSVRDLNENVSAQLNTPLIIMDGFEVSIQQLMDLNDELVQSINIMKDAAATAIYGSRGANGVIVITTKKPKAGRLRVSVSAGVNLEIPDLTSYDLLNAREKLDFEYAMGLYSSENPSEDLLKKTSYYNLLRDVLGGVDTYWLSQPLRTGVGQNYNVQLDGGSDEFRWSINCSSDETMGVMKNSRHSNFSGVINLIYQRKSFTFQNRTSYSRTRGDESNYGAFSQYAEMNPYWKPRDENGQYIERFWYEPSNKWVSNPLWDSQFDSYDYNISEVFSDQFSVEWHPFEGFIVRGQVGFSKTFSSHDIYKSPNSSEFNSTTNLSERGSYDYTTGQSTSIDGNLTISYAKTFAEDHQVYVGLDISAAQSDDYSYRFLMRGYNDRFNFLPNGKGYEENGKPSGSESTTRRVGYTLNTNYTYKNRYYADFSFRMDGSSQFGSNKKFAPFWSGGVGWNIHNEEFLKDLEVFDNLRLRLSYGLTGSQQFESYQALTAYEYDVNDRYLLSTPAFLKGYGNVNLKWQRTSMVNVGFEFSMFDRRLTGSVDYYRNVTSDLLSPRVIPASTGFTTFTDNVGKVENTGLELMLSGYPIRTESGFSWMLSGKMARNKNKILELSPEIKRQTEEYQKNNAEMASLMYEGGSMTDIYAVKSLGIDPSTGQELFLDKDGNITYDWNANAKVLVGNTEPKFRGNLSSNFRYKGFSLNFSFGFHFGGQQYNTTLLNRVEITRSELSKNVDRRVMEDRWYYPGQVTFYKSFYDLDGNPAGKTKASSRFVQDDNMFSLQGISASYQFTGDWLRKHLGMSSLECLINASDIFYVSTIKRERGLNYPFSRRCSFSLKMLF